MKSNPQSKIDISGIVAFVIMLLLIFLTNLLTSCESVVEPDEPTLYTYTIEKDCQSCRFAYWIDESNISLMNHDIPYQLVHRKAQSGDTLSIIVINIAGGVNNNILFPVNGMLIVESTDFYKEVDLGGENYNRFQHIFE